MKHVFIIGSKGIPAKYGGFETFVEYLTVRKQSEDIQYHVSCLANNNDEFKHNNARCFNVKTPEIGSAKAVAYDILSLKECIHYIKRNNLTNCIVYVLACRIGPFFSFYKSKLEKMGVKVFVNPDGHEWKRSKWSPAIRTYWKISEKLMVKNADLLVCDSKGIESYIKTDYKKYSPKTTFIAYGADVTSSSLEDDDVKLNEWYKKHDISANEYYLVVGRFVPENNYELMVREFMKSDSKKDFVIISNVEQNQFYQDLLAKTNFDKDPRVKFVGTVYDQELLKKVRENAFAYFHGHEVGGTNPSLLEALASTKLNMLLDVVFNREVGEGGAVYFSKESGFLANLIHDVERYSQEQIDELGSKAKDRIIHEYSWEKIVSDYESLFLKS
ncbi:beta 1-4 rhamnosyltransferase Cps2T [Bacillus cereus group sp. BceL062]|uniref:beta 1-4 rhamnosyltransferase Cps2T n=1 Tax=Bacillus cereus group TaxID=86661 RepID=UPI0032192393